LLLYKMDISGANDQTNAILNYTTGWNNNADINNKKATAKMNSTISNAQNVLGLQKIMGKTSEGVGGVQTILTGAKQFGDARNFDSDVAGFGKGKGFTGYLSATTQSQLIKGRAVQGLQKTQVALGLRDTKDVAKSGAELGLKKSVPNLQTTGDAEADLRIARSGEAPGSVEGIANPANLTSSAAPTKLVGADPTKVIGKGAEGAEDVAKASGGLLAKGGGAEGGVAGGVIKTAGKFITDMPEGQLGAVSDIAGKGLGFFSAGKAIYDDTQGDWSKDTTLQKAGNVGDMIAGGMDALSIAIPVLAPFAAVASIVSAGLDVAGDVASEKAKEVAAHKTLTQTTMPGETAPSLSSAGLVAKQQITAY
jgi:hypothetical protein